MGLDVNFNIREFTYSTNSYASCQYDIYQDTFST